MMTDPEAGLASAIREEMLDPDPKEAQRHARRALAYVRDVLLTREEIVDAMGEAQREWGAFKPGTAGKSNYEHMADAIRSLLEKR